MQLHMHFLNRLAGQCIRNQAWGAKKFPSVIMQQVQRMVFVVLHRWWHSCRTIIVVQCVWTELTFSWDDLDLLFSEYSNGSFTIIYVHNFNLNLKIGVLRISDSIFYLFCYSISTNPFSNLSAWYLHVVIKQMLIYVDKTFLFALKISSQQKIL